MMITHALQKISKVHYFVYSHFSIFFLPNFLFVLILHFSPYPETCWRKVCKCFTQLIYRI